VNDIRIPPQAIEPEQSVLGSMILEKDTILDVIDILKPDDCYREDNREIFAAIMDLFNQSKPVDIISVSENLKLRGSLNRVGGLEYLSNISNAVPTTGNVKYYAGIVAEKAKLRNLLKSCSDATNMIFNNEDAASVQEKMLQALLAVVNTNIQNSIGMLAETAKSAIDERIKNRGMLPGIHTGFRFWDYKVGGLEKGLLYLFGARPSMGKTALLLCIILYISDYLKIPVMFFSLEMTAAKLIDRIISMITGIPAQDIKTGNLEPEAAKIIDAALSKIKNLPLVIDDTPGLSLSDITARAMKQKLKNSALGLICVDHLTEISKQGQDERIAVTDNCKGMKRLAKNLNIPVILLAQLNRAVEGRGIKRPQLSDLRESGAIEEVADVVTFLYREAYYDESKKGTREDAELIISKCRDGETGTIPLHWYPEIVTFKNPEYQPNLSSRKSYNAAPPKTTKRGDIDDKCPF
jgi:replicative DNA helicase